MVGLARRWSGKETENQEGLLKMRVYQGWEGRLAPYMEKEYREVSKENLQKRKHHGKEDSPCILSAACLKLRHPDSDAQRGPFLEQTENLLACVL